MTMRSKQWYTKTSRLSNSFANNSIGRLPDRASATRSSARRSVESTALLRARRGRKERDSKGKETVGFVPFGLRHKLRQTHASTRKPASSNFKYVWLAFDSVAVRLQELETPRRQIPGRDSLGGSGVHSKVTGVPDFVQPSKDRIEVDSTRLPESQIPRARRSAWGSRDWRALHMPDSASTRGDDAGLNAGLLRTGRQRCSGPHASLEYPLILRIHVEYPRGDALDYVRTIAFRIVHPVHRLVCESKVPPVDLFQTVHRVIDIRKQRSWMRQMDDGEAALFRLIAGALRPA